MQRKFETFGKFKEFLAEVEKQLGKSLKTLRSDRGGEYVDNEFEDYLLEHGIVSQLTAPRSQHMSAAGLEWNRLSGRTFLSLFSRIFSRFTARIFRLGFSFPLS